MSLKKLRCKFVIGLLAVFLCLPIARVAANLSTALDGNARSALYSDTHNQAADPTPGGSGGGGGGYQYSM